MRSTGELLRSTPAFSSSGPLRRLTPAAMSGVVNAKGGLTLFGIVSNTEAIPKTMCAERMAGGRINCPKKTCQLAPRHTSRRARASNLLDKCSKITSNGEIWT